MASRNFDTSEVRRLAADLTRAGPRATRRASQALRKTAADIEADAKVMAPVDTGALRSSIGSDVSAFHAEIGPTVHYGHYVEEGTSRQAPQPYLGPAFDRRTPGFQAAVARIAEDIL